MIGLISCTAVVMTSGFLSRFAASADRHHGVPILCWSTSGRASGSATSTLALVVVGAIGVLLSFLAWSTGPRPTRDDGRR
jgi:hypothetical protein